MPNFSQSVVTNGANVVPRAVGTPSSDGMVEDRSGWSREGVGGELQLHVAGSGAVLGTCGPEAPSQPEAETDPSVTVAP